MGPLSLKLTSPKSENPPTLMQSTPCFKRMRFGHRLHWLWLTVAIVAATRNGFSQLPVISSFSQNGQLTCTNLQPHATATVEWAPSLAGPWSDNWDALHQAVADSNGVLRAAVPMFYRVRGALPPTNGMALIPAGSFTIGNSIGDSDITDAFPTNVTVSGFYMDVNLVSLGVAINL